jgi:hypothetical protein
LRRTARAAMGEPVRHRREERARRFDGHAIGCARMEGRQLDRALRAAVIAGAFFHFRRPRGKRIDIAREIVDPARLMRQTRVEILSALSDVAMQQGRTAKYRLNEPECTPEICENAEKRDDERG